MVLRPTASESSVHDGPPSLPRVFGRYVLFDRIGRGGMADIFLARADTALGGSRLCVVKQMLPGLDCDPGFERMLVAEAKLAARLTHANVVQVFDLGREGDRLFIAMEYVEGFDLNQLLRALSKAKVGLPAQFALFVMREVLRALDYAHRLKDDEGRPLGLVHRDVSPSNVLVSFEGEVKLCDFGIARAFAAASSAEGEAEQIEPSVPKLAGKSAYMSPEHARGERIDARADLFAAGIVLWELCAGRRLYRGSEAEMLAQARRGEVPPLPDRGLPDTPRLQALLERALSPTREARFQSAAEFLQAVEDYALDAKLMASQLRFGSFLTEHFGAQILDVRRERERAARDVVSDIPPVGPPAEPAQANDDATSVDRLETWNGAARVHAWNEPGAAMNDLAPESGEVMLRQAPEDAPGPSLGSGELSELELDRSLMGLDLLAAQGADPASEETTQPSSRAAAPTLGSRDWVWYLVSLGILGLGVLGYLWR